MCQILFAPWWLAAVQAINKRALPNNNVSFGQFKGAVSEFRSGRFYLWTPHIPRFCAVPVQSD